MSTYYFVKDALGNQTHLSHTVVLSQASVTPSGFYFDRLGDINSGVFRSEIPVGRGNREIVTVALNISGGYV